MMTAERFARQGIVWHRSTPILENYVKWMNDNLFGIGESVRSHGIDPDSNSLLSEIAFRSVFEPFESAEASARTYIAGLPRGAQVARQPLSGSDVQEVALLRDNLEAYIRVRIASTAGLTPTFQPRFSGCGVVEPAIGDMLLGNELVEVKAVRRPFRSTDVRQALTYAALGYASAIPVAAITLLNPRQGTYHRADTIDLAPDIGAGSWPELMKDLVDAMSGLEVSI